MPEGPSNSAALLSMANMECSGAYWVVSCVVAFFAAFAACSLKLHTALGLSIIHMWTGQAVVLSLALFVHFLN